MKNAILDLINDLVEYRSSIDANQFECAITCAHLAEKCDWDYKEIQAQLDGFRGDALDFSATYVVQQGRALEFYLTLYNDSDSLRNATDNVYWSILHTIRPRLEKSGLDGDALRKVISNLKGVSARGADAVLKEAGIGKLRKKSSNGTFTVTVSKVESALKSAGIDDKKIIKKVLEALAKA